MPPKCFIGEDVWAYCGECGEHKRFPRVLMQRLPNGQEVVSSVQVIFCSQSCEDAYTRRVGPALVNRWKAEGKWMGQGLPQPARR